MAATATMKVEDLDTVFADVIPLPQDDGPNPVCSIAYSQDFIKAYDYMRAILQSDERSDRALQLTGLCLQLNPANYTVWHFRRLCLQADEERALEQDLEFTTKLGGSNPKNFQIWYHRRALLEQFGVSVEIACKELAYVATVLEQDAKNYHAWSHRQWILRTVDDDNLWNDEMEFVHRLILEDPRNNSAWNQRWFAAHRGSREKLKDLCKEADYAIDGAKLDPYNESPWRYLLGLLKEDSSLAPEYESKASALRSVLYDAGRDPDECYNLTSARIDLLEMKGDKDSIKLAVDLAQELAGKHDVIRKKYWLLRVSELQTALK